MTPVPGAALIAIERTRQRTSLGWTPDHDDCHRMGELLTATAAYLRGAWERFEVEVGRGPAGVLDLRPPICGPDEDDSLDDCLVKAGALIAAELDRRARARAAYVAAVEVARRLGEPPLPRPEEVSP